MTFTKMQGAGNDFVLVENRDGALDFTPELIRRLCDRHYGIGADGVICAENSEVADLKMRIFNSDGSEPEMCGNGIRCFARWAREKWLVDEDEFTVETLAGIVRPVLVGEEVRVDMGAPVLNGPEIPVNLPGEVVLHPAVFAGKTVAITCVSMGNPHCVIFLEDGEPSPVAELGPAVEIDPLFPNKTNVEFVKVLPGEELSVDVWERGAGITLACGTGACAALVAAHLAGRSGRAATIRLPGGTLDVSWEEDGRVLMTGPAEFVFKGEMPLPPR
ncbi:MAG TPA: diaminopimelate epimerase [bacterium]|nr:diaminopimelate epimerase [bacterium]HPQ66624.1 diaminopimelate epimerase [bacterium]